MKTRRLLAIGVLLIAAWSAASASADAGLVSVKHGPDWYWSSSVADAVLSPTRFSSTLALTGATCQGIGSSIPSADPTVNLYHRFRCVTSLSRWDPKTIAAMKAHEAALSAIVAAETPTNKGGDVPFMQLEKFRGTEYAYKECGTAVTTVIEIETTSRRDIRFGPHGPSRPGSCTSLPFADAFAGPGSKLQPIFP